MSSDIRYSVVIPVYNEEAVLEQTYRRLKQVMTSTGETYELIFVNDGSSDHSVAVIKSFCDKDKSVKLISFSRNFGHQVAITAGMDFSAGAAVVVIDADLQDPPELILKMIAKWQEGYEVVYAKRNHRNGETFFKKQTAHLFYRLLRASTEIDIPVDTGDFRLIDRKVCDVLKELPEKNRYVRGLVSWVGFRQTAVSYDRDPRLAGESKYPLQKMIKLSLDGLTSFSFKPIKLASYSGVLLTALGFVYGLLLLLFKVFGSTVIGGWNLVLASELVLTGFLLIIMGIMGEYLGRIYDEARNRPLYIVGEFYRKEEKERNVIKVG
ncbi:glycosyltransferase family 2 protein [Desulfosporosinus sp. PR]|uniref:glycosyltransferase family 2 protein n=1 Tax=Candidatus Desulfosporosinus nitrosoreducens TaxID=3401928 RepID=UPI0027EB087D|nr:glycosyltransferase family 2 protein [Desulfosporosinus sp. PR]MDQ7097162.1 glycosyltransferase family 2 protein [Desulfosporosinus sp. PR]